MHKTEVESSCTRYTLLHVNFHKLDRCVSRCIGITDPDLQVISGGLGEGLAEPWRVVECAAGAGGTTPSTIPHVCHQEKGHGLMRDYRYHRSNHFQRKMLYMASCY